MPAASGAGDAAPPDPVLAAERDHLRRSREFLRLMREDVLGLEAMAGDRASQEYLTADLYHRAQALRDIPDVPGGSRPAGTAGERRRRERWNRPNGTCAAGRAAAHRAPSHP